MSAIFGHFGIYRVKLAINQQRTFATLRRDRLVVSFDSPSFLLVLGGLSIQGVSEAGVEIHPGTHKFLEQVRLKLFGHFLNFLMILTYEISNLNLN
jgi:hypothetical protein